MNTKLCQTSITMAGFHFLAMLVSALPVVAQQYTITDLGPIYISPYGHRIGALGVNNLGQIIGGAPVGGACHAVLWEPGSSTPVDLGTLGGDSYALGISDAGSVVGRYGSPFYSGNTNAFVWDTTNGMRELPPLPGNVFGGADSMNAKGQVAGDSSNYSGDPSTHAVIWNGTAVIDLGTLPGVSYSATFGSQSTMNSYGQVVGLSGTVGGSSAGGGYRAFLWTPTSPNSSSGTMVDLGIVGGARVINGSGTVGGLIATASGARHSFIWTPATPNGSTGTVIDLGTLGGTNADGVYGLNDAGQAVGTSQLLGDTVWHAFIFSGGVMGDLNDLIPSGSEWELSQAFSINNHGQIVGYGSIGGQLHSYLLDPISAVSYNICPLYDQTKAVKSGSTIPIKLQLCDANGANLSSASVTVHAVSVTQVSTNAPGFLDDSGNANPDLDFRYDVTLGSTGGYIYNLSTQGDSTGTYQLNFKAANDSNLHSVQFQVR